MEGRGGGGRGTMGVFFRKKMLDLGVCGYMLVVRMEV